jgi:hypothetical protein
MTLDELGVLIRQNRLIFISIGRTPDGGWQAASRTDSSSGYNTYVTKGDETLDYAVSRVVPSLAPKPAAPAAADEDIFA